MRFLLIFCVSFFAFFGEISAQSPVENAKIVPSLLKEACEKNNDISACYYLGLIEFGESEGEMHGAYEAQPYFQKGCDGGEMNACYELARKHLIIHNSQRGCLQTDSNEKMARHYFQKACEKHHCKSCEKLAQMHLKDIEHMQNTYYMDTSKKVQKEWRNELENSIKNAKLAAQHACIHGTNSIPSKVKEIEQNIEQIWDIIKKNNDVE